MGDPDFRHLSGTEIKHCVVLIGLVELILLVVVVISLPPLLLEPHVNSKYGVFPSLTLHPLV